MKYRPVSRLYTIFLLFFLISIFLLITSCETQRPYLLAKEPPLQEIEQNEIHVECVFMNYRDLEKKHGWKANPFLPPDLGLTPKQMIVFDLKITNKDNTPVLLNTKDAKLYFENKDANDALSSSDMEDKINEWAERAYLLDERKVAKQFMLPNTTTIKGNSTTKGYIVFMGSFKGYDVPTEVVLIFTTQNGQPAADITFAYTLTLMKK